MKILFSGHDFKYEIEATVKLFIPSRFEFFFDTTNADGDIVITRLKKGKLFTYLYAYCRVGEKVQRKSARFSNDLADRSICEHEICRLIYICMQKLTGITPPWGLMTGIRPVKKITALLEAGADKKQAFDTIKKKFMVSDSRLELAYMTAVNQMPLIDNYSPKTVSLYVSIPFCPTRCSYCSFVSHSMDSAYKLIPDYIEYLCREIAITGKVIKDLNLKIDTIYIGGGTPTSITAQQLKMITDSLAKNIDISSAREYNVEAGRADTITRDKLKVIKSAGANRISVNPQTLNNDVLNAIGRNHSAEDTINAFLMARDEGFDNINMDLIAGLPKDTPESFHSTLERIIGLNPESITVHTLTIKRSAGLYEKNQQKYADTPASAMLNESITRLPENGYLPYYLYRQKNTVENLENIGFAKKGKESLYNIFIMDETQTILGTGCAASTKIVQPDGKITRIHNYKFPYEYINRFDELMKKKQQIYELLGN